VEPNGKDASPPCCGDYFAGPHLTCGLVEGHPPPHVAAADRRLFRWVQHSRLGRIWAGRSAGSTHGENAT
jgi:hypothetical protein